MAIFDSKCPKNRRKTIVECRGEIKAGEIISRIIKQKDKSTQEVRDSGTL